MGNGVQSVNGANQAQPSTQKELRLHFHRCRQLSNFYKRII